MVIVSTLPCPKPSVMVNALTLERDHPLERPVFGIPSPLLICSVRAATTDRMVSAIQADIVHEKEMTSETTVTMPLHAGSLTSLTTLETLTTTVEDLNHGHSLSPSPTEVSIDIPLPKTEPSIEKWWNTTIQVLVPFFIAGAGTIAAGLTLGYVQNWKVFEDIPSLFILVPSLVGLKGNLDMCLASRLSTQANLGRLQTWRQIGSMVFGNIGLVQVQAIIASMIVSLFAVSVNAISTGVFEPMHAVVLCSSSLCTATCASLILDFVMIAVVLISHRLKLNPDNVATPIAASIGDIVSITLLSNIADFIYRRHETHAWLPILLICIFILFIPFWVWAAHRNDYTRPVLRTGWTPVLAALFISGCGGLVLGNVVDVLSGFVVFQPIINGIGGNLVSIQSSRISTMLHATSVIGIIPPHTKILASPWKAIIKGLPHAKTGRILLAMSIPGQVCFIYVADYFHQKQTTINLSFVAAYLLVSTVQLLLLLYTAHVIIHLMWRKKIDPDNSAIPYLTALGDLLGTVLLAGAFFTLNAAGVGYKELVLASG